MSQFKVLGVKEDEGIAGVQLPSKETVMIYIGRLSSGAINVRVMKPGFLAVLTGRIWHICLTKNRSDADLGGNILYYDNVKYDPLTLIIGYCSRFQSIREMRAAVGRHAAVFNDEEEYQRLLDLGIFKRKEVL